MPLSIKNLRRGVLAGGIALLGVVAVFLGIARLAGHRLHFNLPGRLGADISQTADGFTWSQSQKGHTLFTIHASKLVEYKGDQAELHDVTITLYGPEGSGRSDKIYGSDFLYDRKQGIARAAGAVEIDFASPDVRSSPPAETNGASPTKAGAVGPDQDATARAANTIHVNTSGVIFNQKTGDATTDQHVDFVLPRATGSALGASYNAKQGVLILDQSVALVTRPAAQASQPAQASSSPQPSAPADDTVLHAEHAQLFRETHQAYLLKAEAVSAGRHTASDQAIVTFRPDGSAQLIDARGHVRITTDDGSQVHASNAVIDLDVASHPTTANLSGGVTYLADQDGRTMQGSAVSGTLSFASAVSQPASAAGRPVQQLHHAQFRNAVSFVLQQHSLPGDKNGSGTREMHASTVDIDFAPGADGRSQAQHVLGAGGATANLHDVPSKGPATTTTIKGDQLLATLANGRDFQVLDGRGDTSVVDTAADGATSASDGDTLHVTFAAAAKHPGAAPSPGAGSAQVDTAVQTGHVSLDQTPAPGASNADGSPSSPFHATAQQAVYHAGDQVLHLTGDPHLRSDTFALSADKVDYHRDSGDADAIGSVKSTYLAQGGPGGLKANGMGLGGSGPVHVTADHAQLVHSKNTSFFYGAAAGELARLWQGGDSVAAPVLELDQDQQSLDAHGESGSKAAVVHATLGSRAAPPGGPATPGTSPQPGPVAAGGVPSRLSSATLHYSDKDHIADLRGSVTAEQPTGVLHADQARVYLSQAEADKPSQLDRMVATGHVVLVQAGRRGTGEKLVYTAADGRYVLTGSPGQQPRLVDSQRGTTTGAALIFKGADDSVEVSSNAEDAATKGAPAAHTRTVTDTHTPR